MGTWVGKARWLEPIGQTVAFGAFSLQFFVVDPDGAQVTAAYFNREFDHLLSVEQLLKGTAPKPTLAETLLHPVFPQLEALSWKIPSDERRRWRPWLFSLFAVGGVLAVAGKAASVLYSTRK
jgi:hypothetical protein